MPTRTVQLKPGLNIADVFWEQRRNGEFPFRRTYDPVTGIYFVQYNEPIKQTPEAPADFESAVLAKLTAIETEVKKTATVEPVKTLGLVAPSMLVSAERAPWWRRIFGAR